MRGRTGREGRESWRKDWRTEAGVDEEGWKEAMSKRKAHRVEELARGMVEWREC